MRRFLRNWWWLVALWLLGSVIPATVLLVQSGTDSGGYFISRYPHLFFFNALLLPIVLAALAVPVRAYWAWARRAGTRLAWGPLALWALGIAACLVIELRSTYDLEWGLDLGANAPTAYDGARNFANFHANNRPAAWDDAAWTTNSNWPAMLMYLEDARGLLEDTTFQAIVPDDAERKAFWQAYLADAATIRDAMRQTWVAFQKPGEKAPWHQWLAAPLRLLLGARDPAMAGHTPAFHFYVIAFSITMSCAAALYILIIFFAHQRLRGGIDGSLTKVEWALCVAYLAFLPWIPMRFSFMNWREAIYGAADMIPDLLTTGMFVVGGVGLAVILLKHGDRISGALTLVTSLLGGLAASVYRADIGAAFSDTRLTLGLCAMCGVLVLVLLGRHLAAAPPADTTESS